jgi:hypothetical protein
MSLKVVRNICCATNGTIEVQPTGQTAVKGYKYSIAGVAQLVERQLPKLNVASSSLVTRFLLRGHPRSMVVCWCNDGSASPALYHSSLCRVISDQFRSDWNSAC